MTIEFFKEQKNIQNINYYSNDGGEWKQPNLNFNEQILTITFQEKFYQDEVELIVHWMIMESGVGLELNLLYKKIN